MMISSQAALHGHLLTCQASLSMDRSEHTVHMKTHTLMWKTFEL